MHFGSTSYLWSLISHFTYPQLIESLTLTHPVLQLVLQPSTSPRVDHFVSRLPRLAAYSDSLSLRLRTLGTQPLPGR